MKTIKTISLLGLILLISVSLYGQNDGHKCGTDPVMKELYQKDPSRRSEAIKFNEITREYIKNKPVNGRAGSQAYTLPVVFHVFGTQFSGYTVDEAKIIESLEQVNIDFQGLNPDYNDVIPYFQSRRSTLDLTFELASIDPDGNATSGVNFYSELSGFGNGSGYDAQIQQYAWDNSKYVNVYIMHDLYADGSLNNSGVAWYPDQSMSDSNLARVVYNGRYLWNNDLDNEFQATLTHEFGHYLNLAHTFDNGCSGNGDNVSDTPATTTNYNCAATETCSGAGIANTSNYMDYSDCRRMFTLGQVDRMDAALQNHTARNTLWTTANQQATGVGPYKIGAHVMASSKWFLEDVANIGSIQNDIKITARDGAQFTMSSGNLTQGTHYNISNVPAGLSAQLFATSNTSLTLRLNGTASSHADIDITNISLTFLNAALAGGTSSVFSATISSLSIDFIDPYQVVYSNIDDITITNSFTWKFIGIPDLGDGSFGAWHFASNHLKFETYTKSLICESGTRNIKKLNYGDAINASSSGWTAGGSYPDQLDIRTSSYTSWDGQSGYFGFQAKNNRNEIIYGWFGATVANDGNSFTITDYGYNEDPNGTSYAGQSGLGQRFTYSTSAFIEHENNDGSIETTINISADEGAQFSASGTLTEGTHYNSSNIPSGLTARVVVNNSTSATLTLQGNVSNHGNGADVSGVSLSFLDAAVVGNASNINSSTKNDFTIDFLDPYKIVYDNIADISVNSTNTWEFFRVQFNGDGYGIWYDAVNDNKLRFETYGAPMVCEGSTRNISVLSQGTEIGQSSNWIAGGAYPDEHDVRSTTYNSWDGQSAFMGFQFVNDYGKTLNGWMRLSVASDGQSMTLFDFAYNEQPNASIYAGDTTNTGGGNPPVANFSANVASVVEGGSVNFSDQSTNNPTSWSWTFSGGSPSSSTDQNPTVTYNTEGTYAVSLTATNADGSDGETKNGYITVTAPIGGTYCESTGTRVSYEWVAGVQVGSFSNSSGAQLYSDYTSLNVDITRGESNPITLTPGFSGSAYNEYWRIWIDYNKDGDFDDTGELAYNAGSASNSAVSGNISPSGSVALGATRMRVSMKYNSAPTSCGSIGDGEVEDYTVIIRDPAPSTGYCDATATNDYNEIERVQFASIDNSSNWGSNGYSDFTATSTTIQRGGSPVLTIDLKNGHWGSSAVEAWIDWNGDEDFDDAGERIYNKIGAQPYSGTVNVPSNAIIGSTRMRIRMSYYDHEGPCGDDTYLGETEDYTINITASGSTGPVGVKKDNTLTEVKLFPNPNNGLFKVKVNSGNDIIKSIKIISLDGKMVYRKTIETESQKFTEQIDLTNKNKGLYMMMLIGERTTTIRKIMIR